MNTYTPNRWVILKLTYENGEPDYRVFAGWSGGYLDSDEWKLNSGIVSHEIQNEYIRFIGESGSVYQCYKGAEGFTAFMSSVLSFWKENPRNQITVLTFDEYLKEISNDEG